MAVRSILASVALLASLLPVPLTGLLCPGSDQDGDGYGTTCDCDDTKGSVYPLAPQICGDGLNNDCWAPGWPSPGAVGDRDFDGDGLRACQGDCQDFSPLIHPGATETCNYADDDCDGRIDAPLQPDADGDGYAPGCGDCNDGSGGAVIYPGAPEVCDGQVNNCWSPEFPFLTNTNEADDDGDGFSECDGDCNDASADVYPGRNEICNGVDDDCDGRRDAPINGGDADNDGYSKSCSDCDDHNPSVYPGAPDLCDGLNNACIQVRALTCGDDTTLRDVDDDCDGFSDCQGDCRDVDPLVFPGAPEICDGRNNDCSDPSWPAVAPEEMDLDHDGVRECAGDCTDYDASTYPGAAQLCDGRNNDCGDPAWPVTPAAETDADGDLFRLCNGDCDDADPRVRPGASQICDGDNNDCDDPAWPTLAGTNEGDNDGDLWPECSGDCNDADARILPGGLQVCDGVNNDCDDPAWPAVSPAERDNDGDGRMGCSPIPDCNNALASAWAPPGEARGLYFADPTVLIWNPPQDPGGTFLRYDVLRADSPASFISSTICSVFNTAVTTDEDETVDPPAGAFFSYLVRVRNLCPAGNNTNLGTDSAGVPRVGRACP